MSELNGRRPDQERQPGQQRPVTFAWQRHGGAPTSPAVPPARAARKPEVSAGPPPAPARGPVQTVAPPTEPETSPDPPKTPPSSYDSGGGSHRTGTKRARRRRRGGPDTASGRVATTRTAPAPPAAPQRKAQEDTFAVPPPGGRLSSGRGAHLGLRVVFALTTCVLLLALAFVFGLLAGRVGTNDHSGVSAQQLNRYHVDQYPLQAGAAVASRYADLCLNADPAGADSRSAQLQGLVSSNVASDCGWDGRGTLRAADIAWTGQADPMAQYGAHGRYLHMQAALGSQGTLVQLVVPVYVSNLHDGTGTRVAGVPGIMPAGAGPSPADAVLQSDSATGDTGLAQMLTTDVLPGFFDAWATSSSPDIDRYRTTDATRNVRMGMSNAVSDPQIEDVSVPVPGTGLSSTHTWKVGDSATVDATITWQLPRSAHVTVGYRLTMLRTSATATGWSIRDISGGLPDIGLDSSVAGNSLPTALPSESASAPPSATSPSTTHAGASRSAPARRTIRPAPSR